MRDVVNGIMSIKNKLHQSDHIHDASYAACGACDFDFKSVRNSILSSSFICNQLCCDCMEWYSKN